MTLTHTTTTGDTNPHTHSNVTVHETEEQILQRLETSPVLLDVQGLCVDYVTEDGNIRACDDITFTLRRGEILGVAGESASGKSTLLNALGRLQRMPAATSAGEIWLHPTDGSPRVDLVALSEEELEPYRWSNISIVMQSAMACLNPVIRLGEQFTDVLQRHDKELSSKAAMARAGELLSLVGISSERLTAFPFQLSGGMQQRALIALSLACNPDLVLMDEPTTAVDVVMQRQILQQLLSAQAELGFAIVFVTHDLSLLLEISDKIAIMYGGKIVEIGTAKRLHESAKHPYTRALRRAFPPLSEPVRRLQGIPGSPPDLLDLPKGCAFSPRCDVAMPICHERIPELRDIPGGRSACFFSNGELSSEEIVHQQGERALADNPIQDSETPGHTDPQPVGDAR
ncbi:ABC transporter ATP-binding protein [Devriesea agamarum]|uniref:ABC transporter ATP-binding protein n=1 Tax=Devriesea agamarum TaxID=472569 RepID=UPI0009FD88BD|nr:ABC transporter ATP-binding protein [Devriesea agamarum]